MTALTIHNPKLLYIFIKFHANMTEFYSDLTLYVSDRTKINDNNANIYSYAYLIMM